MSYPLQPMLRTLALARQLPSFLWHWFRQRMPLRGAVFGALRFSKCWLSNEIEVAEFFEFRLWRREVELERCLEFLGWRKHIYALKILSPAQYRCTTENKLIFHGLCASGGLATPELLGVYDPLRRHSAGVRIVRSIDELRELVEDRHVYEIILKPVEGTRGQSVRPLSYNRVTQHFSTPDGCVVSVRDLEKSLSPYTYRGVSQSTFIIQERVLPSADTKHIISPYVPFSYRFLTLWDEDHGAQIMFAYGKAATGDRLADNLHAGGLALIIDPKGTCIGARKADKWQELLTHHPTTGAELSGMQCPEYARAAEIALDAARRFSFVRCVAWDVLVGCNSNGDRVVQMLEGNNPFNYDIQLVCDSGMWTNRFASEVERIAKNGLDHSPWC